MLFYMKFACQSECLLFNKWYNLFYETVWLSEMYLLKTALSLVAVKKDLRVTQNSLWKLWYITNLELNNQVKSNRFFPYSSNIHGQNYPQNTSLHANVFSPAPVMYKLIATTTRLWILNEYSSMSVIILLAKDSHANYSIYLKL